MAADPAALQLRLLQTVVEVAAEKNSTLVMPFPVELLRFFDRASLTASASLASTGAEDAAALPAPPALPATVLANPPASRPATVAPNGTATLDPPADAERGITNPSVLAHNPRMSRYGPVVASTGRLPLSWFAVQRGPLPRRAQR